MHERQLVWFVGYVHSQADVPMDLDSAHYSLSNSQIFIVSTTYDANTASRCQQIRDEAIDEVSTSTIDSYRHRGLMMGITDRPNRLPKQKVAVPC